MVRIYSIVFYQPKHYMHNFKSLVVARILGEPKYDVAQREFDWCIVDQFILHLTVITLDSEYT